MRLHVFVAILCMFLHCSNALNIIVSNDDGFATANVRELYRLLKKDGHDVYLVAPARDQSGQGGRSVFTASSKLRDPSQYNIIPAGAPSFGTDPHDSHIWYYDGTPVACTLIALDYVVPMHTNWRKVDLLVAGPNYGRNLGVFLYTVSGTMGGAYTAIERGVPAISFSASDIKQHSYLDLKNSSSAHVSDSATIVAHLSVQLVSQLADCRHGRNLLPNGYGLNVNYPELNFTANRNCTNPRFIQTRLTGGSEIAKAVYNNKTKTFSFGITRSVGSNTCITGNCSLPGETDIVNAGCYSSVSVFTVDYDAPDCRGSKQVRPLLQPLVQFKELSKGKASHVSEVVVVAGHGYKAPKGEDVKVTEPVRIPGDNE